MATFVLVPGAWLGGWCWKYVTPRLRDEGHAVVPSDCTVESAAIELEIAS